MRHSGEKKYKCPYCSYSCIQATSYKVHIRRKHPPHADQSSGVVWNCNKCLFKTLKESNFLAHLVEHNDDAGAKSKASRPEVKAQEADTTTGDGGGNSGDSSKASSSK